MNECYGCRFYDPKRFYCQRNLMGTEKAIHICPFFREREMQEVANRNAYYAEALND